MIDRLARGKPASAFPAFCALAAMLILALPLPWTYTYRASSLTTRSQTKALHLPMAPAVPVGIRWYARMYDGLQKWLIERSVCRRRQEHAAFEKYQRKCYPFERNVAIPHTGDHAVLPVGTVGVPGWLLGGIHLIDVKGLNDYVVARTPSPRPSGERRMAHDRFPPPGYVECFRYNVYRTAGGIRIRERARPLSPREICECERSFRAPIDEALPRGAKQSQNSPTLRSR